MLEREQKGADLRGKIRDKRRIPEQMLLQHNSCLRIRSVCETPISPLMDTCFRNDHPPILQTPTDTDSVV